MLDTKTKLRSVITSFVEASNVWFEMLQRSLSIANLNPDKSIFFSHMPAKLDEKLRPMQFLIVLKYFRPDALPRAFEYFI